MKMQFTKMKYLYTSKINPGGVEYLLFCFDKYGVYYLLILSVNSILFYLLILLILLIF